MAGPPWTNIVAHRASALPTFIAIELTGIFALVGLIQMIRGKGLARWNAFVVLILAIVSLFLTARTTHLGRQIFVLERFVRSPTANESRGTPRRRRQKR